MASRLQDVILRDTRANQPLATDVSAGTLYYVTDESVTERSDGTNWEDYSDSGTGTGDVVGPASSTDEAIARFDGVTGKLLQDSVVTISNTGVITFPDDIRQTFNPGANNPGINVGSFAGDPATPSNGDIWYNSTTNELKVRINGSTVIVGSGGITQLTGDVTAGPGSGSQAATIANDAVTTVKILAANVTPAKLSNDAKTYSRGITVDGGGSVVTTGLKGNLRIPIASTIIRWSLMADLAGDVEFDIFADDPGSTYPPTTSIVAAAPPTLSGADFDDDTTLTGWTTSIPAGTVIGFEVTGVPDTITRVSLQLDLRLA